MATLFELLNGITLLIWVVLLIFVKNDFVIKLIKYGYITILCIVYSLLIVCSFQKLNLQSFSSLENVQVLFQDKTFLTAGWIHYLAFDLFIGIYIVQQNTKIQLAHYILLPTLILTFLFGPIGLLLFYIFKLLKKQPQ